MADVGSPQSVVVCQVSTVADAGMGVCPSGSAPAVVDGYLLSATQMAAFQVAAQPFDPAVAGEYFGMAFSATVGLWAVAYGLGQLVRFLRTS